MAAPNCHNCVYSICDTELLLRKLWAGEPLLPRCANHPQWPGQLREVPGVACRNYRPRPKVPEGDVRLIPLGDGFYAYVDAADYEWLSQWKWHMCSAGYAARKEKTKYVFMHRQIMQPPEGMQVDHIDCSKANNCRFNLRVCTRLENQRNHRKRVGSHSRFKGVYFNKQLGKCFAKGWFAGRALYLGCFDEEVDAARAYDLAAVAWYGEFARPNFPEEWPLERREQVYAEAQAEREALLAKAARKKKQKGKEKQAKGKNKRSATKRTMKKGKKTKPRTETPGRRDRNGTTHAARRATKEKGKEEKATDKNRKPAPKSARK